MMQASTKFDTESVYYCLDQYNATFICLHSAIIHDTKMSEPEALLEKDVNNQEITEDDAVSKRKVVRCDLKVPRFRIKSRLEAELDKEEEQARSLSG